MDQLLELGFAFGSSYLIGCCVAGYYLTRWRTGTDLRELGSGSAGARNTARFLGKGFGVAAFAWDFAKGALAALLARYLGEDMVLTSIGVVLGHVWPAQLGFRGGKGVAPGAGVLAVLQPWLLGIVAAAYALAGVMTRSVARRAIAAFGTGVAAIPFLAARPHEAILGAALLGILIFTHRDGFPSNEATKKEAK